MAQKIFTVSLFCVALSIAYFAFELGKLTRLIPPILSAVDRGDMEVAPLVEEVREIRKQIPSMVKAVNQASLAVSEASVQVAKTLPLIPPILEESKNVRVAIPAELDKMQTLIQQAGGVITNANNIAENAGTNVLTGLIKSPFKLVSNLGNSFFDLFSTSKVKLSDEEKGLVSKTAAKVLESNDVGYQEKWTNKKTNLSGIFALTALDVHSGCKTLVHTLYEKTVEKEKRTLVLCADENKKWQLKN